MFIAKFDVRGVFIGIFVVLLRGFFIGILVVLELDYAHLGVQNDSVAVLDAVLAAGVHAAVPCIPVASSLCSCRASPGKSLHRPQLPLQLQLSR